MAQLWPPSPTVEDEEISLAREHGSDDSGTDAEHGKPPAVSRGSVDQYPLIMDLNAKDEANQQNEKPQKKQIETVPNRATKADSVPPPKPHPVNDEKRYVFVPSASSNTLDVPTTPPRPPRSKSTTRIAGDETPRGRPQIHRIQTDFGGDLHAMASGQRRAPSPYAYRPSPSINQSTAEDRSKSSLLSPESAALPRVVEGTARRSRSAHPDRRSVPLESSDSDHKPSQQKLRSKSRSGRQSDSKATVASGEERLSSRRPDRRDSYRRSQQSPPRERYSEKSHKSAHGHITPPETPSQPRESPYTSAAEESDRPRNGTSRRPKRRHSRESPYTSAAEENYRRQDPDERCNEVSSRRGSTRRINKPHLDLSEGSQRSRFIPGAPFTTGHSSKAMEDYFQKAVDDNHARHTKHRAPYSAHPSPLSSPPTSPPRTPRGERQSRDYFEASAPFSSPSKQRSRPPSMGENPIKPLTSLSAATLGASVTGKTVPTLSRSSTASLETSSSGSHSPFTNAPRSRKPSPVHEDLKPADARPLSRAGSLTGKDDLLPSRGSPLVVHYDRPVSRAGSTASWDDPNHNRASAFPLQYERPSSRSGAPVTSGMDHPPIAQRSSSYSSHDQYRTRPSSRRTCSTNGSTTIMPASTYHPTSGPSHLSRMSYAASSSSERGPVPPTPSAKVEQRTPSFPKCPQPYPVAGYHHWYTVQGLQNFDICSSCASVLGKSAFRDYCVPGWKPATEAITCALSRPWTRIAIAGALKDGSANVTLLQELNKLPAGVLPCPGSQSDVRRWYHITDPTTKSPVSNFDVCTACVRSAELLFPELRREKLFERPEGKLSQERTCNLNAGSKHFYAIFNELEKLAGYSKQKDLRPKDIAAFAGFVRQKTRYRECAKDALLGTTLWHYIPGLPEFTICEECFEEVVWPMRDMPIAKDVIKTLQKVPVQRPDQYVAGISCQLYSDRMRAMFKNACSRNDFDGFKQNAIMRYNTERKLQERCRMLEQDMRARIDRREELEKTRALWKTYE